MFSTKLADRYTTGLTESYEEPQHCGLATLPVLTFLEGKPWNDLALSAVNSLRPSSIITITAPHPNSGWNPPDDRRDWRVVVYLKSDGRTIKRIEQECLIGNMTHREWLEAMDEQGKLKTARQNMAPRT